MPIEGFETEIEENEPIIDLSQSNGLFYQQMFVHSFGKYLGDMGAAFLDYDAALDRMIKNDFELGSIDTLSVEGAKRQAAIMKKGLNDLMKNHKFNADIQNVDDRKRSEHQIPGSGRWRTVADDTYTGGELTVLEDIRRENNPSRLVRFESSLVSKIALSLTAVQIKQYMVERSRAIFPHAKYLNTETNSVSRVFGAFDKDGVKQYAEALRGVVQLRAQRPWYIRWFYSDPADIKQTMKQCSDFLVEHGVDEKALQSYLTSGDGKKEASFEKLWQASAATVEMSNIERQDKYEKTAAQEADQKELETREIQKAEDAPQHYYEPSEEVEVTADFTVVEEEAETSDDFFQENQKLSDLLLNDFHADEEIEEVFGDDEPEAAVEELESELGNF